MEEQQGQGYRLAACWVFGFKDSAEQWSEVVGNRATPCGRKLSTRATELFVDLKANIGLNNKATTF